MTYKIVENDVRLLRRVLVALNYKEAKVAEIITKYLRDKGLKFVLPYEQAPHERLKYYRAMETRDIALAEEFGCVLLPDYNDCIFLNREWKNPLTLYVRLVDTVPELGVLGAIYWSPDEKEHLALAMLSEAYVNQRKAAEDKTEKIGIWRRLVRAFHGG